MKHGISHTLALIGLGMATFAVTPVHAQTAANGPYYATPSWDQQLPASTRFVVLSNWVDANFPSGGAAVLDRETGLVWERSPQTDPFTWSAARTVCNNSATGGRRAWRLPWLHELGTLVDPKHGFPGPFLPAGHPFTNVQNAVYFSATADAEHSDIAGAADFSDGEAGLFAFKTSKFNVWCVRGVSSEPIY
jgi:hypothetical protein